MKISKLHDGLFKSFLTVPETAKDFLEIHLPEPFQSLCDLTTLTLKPNSFLEDDLRPYYSDVLYSVQTKHGAGYVYALIEHQSTPDKQMGFRLMRYAIATMQQHLVDGHKELPLVVPLLFYHGQKSPYPYSLNWLEMFAEPALAKRLYSEPFPLVDVTVIPDDEIMQHKRVAALEYVQKHARHRDMLESLHDLVILLSSSQISGKQVKILVEYIAHVGETRDLPAFLDKLAQSAPEHEGTFMTIAEQLRQQGRQQGLEQGLQQGLEQGLEQGLQQGEERGLRRGRQEAWQEARQEIARKLLRAGNNIATVCELTGLDQETVAKLSC